MPISRPQRPVRSRQNKREIRGICGRQAQIRGWFSAAFLCPASVCPCGSAARGIFV